MAKNCTPTLGVGAPLRKILDPPLLSGLLDTGVHKNATAVPIFLRLCVFA